METDMGYRHDMPRMSQQNKFLKEGKHRHGEYECSYTHILLLPLLSYYSFISIITLFTIKHNIYIKKNRDYVPMYSLALCTSLTCVQVN